MAFIYEDIKPSVHVWRWAFEILRVELVDECAQQPGRSGSELGDELCSALNAR